MIPSSTRRAIAAFGLVAAFGAATADAQMFTQTESQKRMQQARETLPPNAARVLFGGVGEPAPLAARSIGSYARGCLAGARAMSVNGAAWQVMRLSRNRNWGHPVLIDFLERFAKTAQAEDGWNGLLVGDLSQARGGPMLTGHTSHQIGLDADIWFMPMPDRTLTENERENMSAVSMLRDGTREIDYARFKTEHARVVRRAALDGEVARIFVHPAIKKALCDWADNSGWSGGDRAWLRKVRPWYGHHYHFHIRMKCPDGSGNCRDQKAPPAGDGCGGALAWWLSDEPWRPRKPSATPKKRQPLTLASLPAECRQVLVSR